MSCTMLYLFGGEAWISDPLDAPVAFQVGPGSSDLSFPMAFGILRTAVRLKSPVGRKDKVDVFGSLRVAVEEQEYSSSGSGW